MLISPHMETAADFVPQVDFSPQTRPVELSGMEPYNSGLGEAQDRPEDREGFAEILAGLLSKTETGEAENAEAAVDADSAVSLAGDAEIPAEFLAASPAAALKNGFRRESVEAEGGAADGFEQAGETAQDFDTLELSGEEQNILLMVEHLLNRPAGAISPDEEAYLAGEVTLDETALFEGSADFFRGEAETAQAAFEPPELDLAAIAEMLDEAAAGLAAESPEHLAELKNAADAKNARPDRAESGAGAKQAAGAEQLLAAAKAAGSSKPAEQGNLSKNAGGEKDGTGRLDAARGRDKRRGFSVELRDFRNAQGSSASRTDAAQVRAGLETRPLPEANPREITLELHLPSQAQDAPLTETAANATWETKASQAAENMLARELHQNFNNDIVRHASMALHEGGTGTIKLALKPEALGNVKIRLEMAENKITGHIVVESEEALRAFERELDSLEQAFMDSGFDAANLEMSLASDGGGAEQFWQEAEASRFVTNGAAASRYDAAIERAEPVIIDVYQRSAAVNVLA